MKLKIYFCLGLLTLVMGCASHREKIVFNDANGMQPAVNAEVVPMQKELDETDEWKIEQLVFGYLLERHFWDLADYSAVFLAADDAHVAEMMKQFPQHIPPIKPSAHISLSSHRAPMDKDTGKPAMILSVEVNAPNADDSVDALGRWYAGEAVSGFRAFHLQMTNDDWQIVSVK